MKLYATTTSERASKEQRGNKFIRMEMTAGSAINRIDAGMIEMRYTTLNGSLNGYDEVEISYFKTDKGCQIINTIKIPHIKGKSQKGENKYLCCTWCGKNPPESKLSEYCSPECRYSATSKR